MNNRFILMYLKMGISNMRSYISTEKSHVVWNYKNCQATCVYVTVEF